MVGKLFQVIFSSTAKKRLRDISDHYTSTASPAVGRKIRHGIVTEAKKLEKLPESNPVLPNTEDVNFEVRYSKAWSYKIIFRVLNPFNIVRILTIRHDKEAPEEVKKDL